MVGKLQASILFCEDYRVEVSGQPMLIGVLPPVFVVERCGIPDQICLATLIYAPPELDEVKVSLKVTVPGSSGSSEKKGYHQTFRRPDDSDRQESWAVHVPLWISVPPWEDGAEVHAQLTCDHVEAEASVIARVSDSEDYDDADGGEVQAA